MLRCLKFVGTGLVLGLLVWAIFGCDSISHAKWTWCECEVIDVYEVETGAFTPKRNWMTMIEYPNGERKGWTGKFGEVGEVITVKTTVAELCEKTDD